MYTKSFAGGVSLTYLGDATSEGGVNFAVTMRWDFRERGQFFSNYAMRLPNAGSIFQQNDVESMAKM